MNWNVWKLCCPFLPWLRVWRGPGWHTIQETRPIPVSWFWWAAGPSPVPAASWPATHSPWCAHGCRRKVNDEINETMPCLHRCCHMRIQAKFVSIHSLSGRLRSDLHDRPDKKDCSQRWLSGTLPGHPSKLHEGHSRCQHQLRGLRVHEERFRNFQMTWKKHFSDGDVNRKLLRKATTSVHRSPEDRELHVWVIL